MAYEHTVEKGYPIPERRCTKYPYGKMDVGDSFYCTEERTRLYSSSSQYGLRNGMKFSVRKEGDGYRVWRIS